MQEVSRKMAKGAAWMVFFKLLERSLGLISTVILARLLVPADFGLMAMAMSIAAVLELLGAFGFDTAIIQNQQAERRHYDTAWTFEVLFGLASAVALVLLAVPGADFYHEPRLEAVMYVLALGAFVQGLQNIGIVAFRKEMQFNKEFKFLLSKKLVSFLVTVPLAVVLQSYWALLAGIITGKLVGLVLSYAWHPYRPRLSFAAGPELFHFSKWLLLNNILFFLRHRSADFIVGRIAGTGALGLYTIAYEISNLPTTELVAPINRAVFPGYAKQSADPEALRQGYLNVTSLIWLFALPAAVGIAVTADLLVPVVLGTKWTDASPLIAILALYGAVTAMQGSTGYVYIALGKPRITTLLSGFYLAVLIPALIWLTMRVGLQGTCWAYLGTALLILPINYVVLIRTLRMQVSRLFAVIWRPVLASAVMFLSVKFYILSLPISSEILTQIIQLFIAVALGVLCYGVALFGLWVASSRPHGAERLVLDQVTPRIKKIYGMAFSSSGTQPDTRD